MKPVVVQRGEKTFVPFLYQIPAFDAFDDFSDFVESTTCETSKSCQVRGSNPCQIDQDRLCVDQGIRQRFARGRTCLRERFASPTSKPPNQLPTRFPSERARLLSDRPNDSPPAVIRPGVTRADIPAAPATIGTSGPTPSRIQVRCKRLLAGSRSVTALAGQGENGNSADTSPDEGW
jgi:hypothetical protein